LSARYEIVDVVQGSWEWFEARRGIPTASRFSAILARGKGGAESKMRYTYMKQLAGEIMTGEPMETYTNEKMERGKKHEPDLRARYAFERDVDVQQVGFLRMNPDLCATGCSPDGLIGDDGMVEFKSAEPPILIDILRSDPEAMNHMPQIQGGLWISGRKWCDLVIGWPKMPLSITRINRSDTYIGPLSVAVKTFNTELAALVKELKDK
jgi:hypothetical protein